MNSISCWCDVFQEESDNDSAESEATENSDDSKQTPCNNNNSLPQPPALPPPHLLPAPAAATTVRPGKGEPKRSRGWEIMEGLRSGQTCEQKPDKFEGFMMKRRKWPMKGWHKV